MALDVKKQPENLGCFIHVVRTERLELSHLSAPEPKSGASTNFATSALFKRRRDYTENEPICKSDYIRLPFGLKICRNGLYCRLVFLAV